MIHEASSTFKWSNWMSSFRVPWLYNFTFFCNWPCLRKPPQKKWPGNSGRAFLSDRNGSVLFFNGFLGSWNFEDPHQDADLGSSWCCMNSSQVSSFQCDMDCSLQAASNAKTPRDPADPGKPESTLTCRALGRGCPIVSGSHHMTFLGLRFLPTCHWWPLFFAAQTAGRTLSFWSWMAF